MKAVIYAGLGLFSIASVYGIADYYSSSSNGSLQSLYAEEAAPVNDAATIKTPLITPFDGESLVNVAAKKERIANAGKAFYKKAFKKFNLDDFSRGRIVEVHLENIQATEEPVKQEAAVNEPAVPVQEPAVEVIKEDRKISLESFSRAPLKIKLKKDKRKAASLKEEKL